MPKCDWSKLPPVVLISGSNEFLKSRELNRAILEFSEYRLLEYDASQDIEKALSVLNTRSLFNDKKLVVIHAIGSAKSKKKELSAYCENPNKDTILILVTQHQKRVLKWLSSLKVSQHCSFDSIPSWDFPKWVLEEASLMGLSFPTAFADAIVMNVGEDHYALANELEKLRIYCGSRTEVNVSDIEAVLFQHTSFSPFEVVKIWGMGDTDHAVRLYLSHLDNTPKTDWMRSVLVILGTLQDRVENLLTAKALKASGKGSDAIAKALKISPFIYTDSVVPQMKARKSVALEDAYIELARIESQVKLGGPGKLLLESFLLTH